MEIFSIAWALAIIKEYGGKMVSPLIKPAFNFLKDQASERRGIEHIFAMVFKKAVEEFVKEKAKSPQIKEFTYTGFVGFLQLFFKQTDYEKEFFYQLFLSDKEYSDKQLFGLIQNFKTDKPHYAEYNLLHFHEFLREKLKKEPIFASLIWQKDTYLYAAQTAENVEHLLMFSQEQMTLLEELQKQILATQGNQLVEEQFKELNKKLDDLLISVSQVTETNVQRADKIYNIGNANNPTFTQSGNITNNINSFPSQKPNNHPLYLWVISTTKGKIVCSEELHKQFPIHRYHETNCAEWQPFENEGTISELIAEYKTEVQFEVWERFLAKNPIQKEEEAAFFKNTHNIVLVLDPFALHTENLTTAQHFNNDKIGACLILLCQSVSFDLFAYIRSQIEQVFGVLHTCFLDYKEKYLHFVFPISTKELFFRTLSNIALLRLEIATQIEDLDKQGKLQNKTFKF